MGIFRKTSIRCFQSEAQSCLQRQQMNIYRFYLLCSGIPPSNSSSACRGRRETRQSGNSRICAQMVMTDNKRAQVAIPHQDRRNLSCLAWFSSPRGTTCNTNFRREMKLIRRISHGSARAIEGLRRMWLPLVPGPDSRECVLQGMRIKTKRFSIAGKSQAARTPEP